MAKINSFVVFQEIPDLIVLASFELAVHVTCFKSACKICDVSADYELGQSCTCKFSHGMPRINDGSNFTFVIILPSVSQEVYGTEWNNGRRKNRSNGN